MHAQIGHASTSLDWHVSWGWKSRKGLTAQESSVHLILYCHVILAKPCTFPTCNEALPGVGGGYMFPCSLEKMALFPQNKILILYVPCSPKLPVFPLFLSLCSPVPLKKCLCSPVPQNPWAGLCNIEIKRGFLCTNVCQVPILPISDILFIEKYPEMGRGYYRIVSSRKGLLYR